MFRELSLILAFCALSLCSSRACAESWACGGAKIHCGGSQETCQALKRACTQDVQASTEVDRELLQAVHQAQNGTLPPTQGDPFERLSRSVAFQGCTEQQVKEGQCGVFYNTKELVSSVVDTIRYSAEALNQASKILQGGP
jgi:hypothetical protein